MCGRFASARKRQELLAEFQVERDRVPQPLEPDYNVAPTKQVYAVLTRRGRGEGVAGDREGRPGGEGAVARELRLVRWGLVPSWAKDVSIGNRLINARAETVDTKPAFRRAFAQRRCLLPADGFYEWHEEMREGRTRKQPYYIHRADGKVLAFAGLYEIWRDRSVPDDDPGAWLWTAAIITTRAQDEVGRIHDRMPMVIEPARWSDWLDPGADGAADLRGLLTPAVTGGLTSHPVSTDVNSVRNNGPGLIRSLAGTGMDGHGPAGKGTGDGPGGTGPPGAGGQGVRPLGRPKAPDRDPAGTPLTLF